MWMPIYGWLLTHKACESPYLLLPQTDIILKMNHAGKVPSESEENNLSTGLNLIDFGGFCMASRYNHSQPIKFLIGKLNRFPVQPLIVDSIAASSIFVTDKISPAHTLLPATSFAICDQLIISHFQLIQHIFSFKGNNTSTEGMGEKHAWF